MSLTDPLCALPAPLSSGCCSGVAPLPAAPALISNPAGLSAIQYRIGTFSTFRRAMLDRVAVSDLMASAVTGLTANIGPLDTSISVVDFDQFPPAAPYRLKIKSEYLLVTSGAGSPQWTVTRGVDNSVPADHFVGETVTLIPPNPFARWHEGIDGDYQTMFVELWAYLADILTFYQERIANEAFITTATQRDSLLRLVRLTDYHPSPGAGASGLVAFTAAKNTTLAVPGGFRIGSRAQPGKAAVVFETASAITALGDNSAIPLSKVGPANQFGPLAGSATTREVVLEGINNRLTAGDYILTVQNEGVSGAELASVRQVTTVTPDKISNQTVITCQEPPGTTYDQTSRGVVLYAFRVVASPFGSTAPAWSSLSSTLTNADGQHPGAPYPNNWDSPFVLASLSSLQEAGFALDLGNLGGIGLSTPIPIAVNPWYFVPTPDDANNLLFLDGVRDEVRGTPQNPGWAALVADGVTPQVLHIADARQSSRAAYTISSKVTRLTFFEPVLASVFPLRSTLVFAGAEALPLKNQLPLPDPVSGKTLILAGIHSALRDGQKVILRGTLFDLATNSATQTSGAESAILDGPPLPDQANQITIVNLKKPLANAYTRASCVLMANVVEINQGETVKDEVLGSSNGAAFQSYALKQKPLTYLPSTDPESSAAVQSTLLVKVNGVAWNEQPTLIESAPDAQDFTTALDESGQTTILFGDGFNGARPPSGTNNIRARYRKGLGSSGNLASDSIQQLLDSIMGLQKVTNPFPSSGGGDPENVSQIRTKAPASLQTFGRAVSAADYAALALSYPGIAKARATWVIRDPITLRAVPHPYIQLTAASVDRTAFQDTVFGGKLRQFLDSHRDPNVPLRILDFTQAFIEVEIDVDIDDRFPHQGTLDLLQAALNPDLNADGSAGYFAFERLNFGQSIFQSSVYAAVQGVAGIKDARITTLRPMGSETTIPGDVLIGPTEIATIDPTDPLKGKLTITGEGGFRDV